MYCNKIRIFPLLQFVGGFLNTNHDYKYSIMNKPQPPSYLSLLRCQAFLNMQPEKSTNQELNFYFEIVSVLSTTKLTGDREKACNKTKFTSFSMIFLIVNL